MPIGRAGGARPVGRRPAPEPRPRRELSMVGRRAISPRLA